MYGIVYDWFLTLFAGSGVSQLQSMSFDVGGASLNGVEWFCHVSTVIVLAVLAFVAFKFVWWLVRLMANAWQARG